MASNFPGPYGLRIFYEASMTPGGVLLHQMEHNVDVQVEPSPGDKFDSINFKHRDTTHTQADVVTDEWVDLLKGFCNSAATTFIRAELWKYEAGTFNADYISTYTLTQVGTSASAAVRASQAIWVYRTQEGGIMKHTLIDTVIAQAEPRRYADLSAGEQAVVDWVLDGAQNTWLGRDTSWPIAFMGLYPGLNEATFKQRYRP